MLDEGELHTILEQLANGRPVFHSEDDFKFALAQQIKVRFPNAQIRLEFPFRSKKTSSKANKTIKKKEDKYIDILVSFGNSLFPIELKYKTRTQNKEKILKLEYRNEEFELSEHGAQIENTYRFWRDVWRIENFIKEKSDSPKGFVIFLTNRLGYSENEGKHASDVEFRIHQGREVKKHILKWQKNTKTAKREEFSSSIPLNGQYKLDWKDFSNKFPNAPTRCGKFIYLLVEVNR